MDLGFAIPLSALVVSLATLVFSAISLKRKANGNDLEKVEIKIARLEQELKECRAENDRLQRQYHTLLKQFSERS